MPRTRPQEQLGLMDEVVDDKDLEQLLEDLDDAKEAVAKHRKGQKRLKELLPPKRTEGKRIRCGRFIITGAISPGGKEIAFETGPGYHLKVEVAGD